MFDFISNAGVSNSFYMAALIVLWAGVDYVIVKVIDARKAKKEEAARFVNRKPTIIY